MVDIQTVSIAIASASVTLAAIYYIFQIRHQTRIRQTDLVIRLYSVVSSKEFLEAWEIFRDREFKSLSNYKKKYGSFLEVNQLFAFFDEVGVLLRRKLIDTAIAEDLFGDAVKTIKEKVGGYSKDRPNFEYLYNEMKKREQKLQQKSVQDG
jgi:hypothetical protein